MPFSRSSDRRRPPGGFVKKSALGPRTDSRAHARLFERAEDLVSRPPPSEATRRTGPRAPRDAHADDVGQRINPNIIEDTADLLDRAPEEVRIHPRGRHASAQPDHSAEGQVLQGGRDVLLRLHAEGPPRGAGRPQGAAAATALANGCRGHPGRSAAIEDHGMPPEDFEDLTPARVSASFRLRGRRGQRSSREGNVAALVSRSRT